MDTDTILLKEILVEIDFLETSLFGVNFDFFVKSEEKKRAVSMALINIGEFVNRLSKNFKELHNDIPFIDITGMRNVAAHGYRSLRFERIWNTVTIRIPELKAKIKEILEG